LISVIQLVPSRISRYDLPSSQSQVSQRNHANLGNFSNPDDLIYKTIRGFVRRIVSQTRDTTKDRGVSTHDTNTPWKIVDKKWKAEVDVKNESLSVEREPDSFHETGGSHLQDSNQSPFVSWR